MNNQSFNMLTNIYNNKFADYLLYLFGFKKSFLHNRIINKDIFVNLPKDIIIQIFLYCGIVVERNGIYLNRFSKMDPRYKIFKNISKKYVYNFHLHDNFVIEINFKNKKHKMFIFNYHDDIIYNFTSMNNKSIRLKYHST